MGLKGSEVEQVDLRAEGSPSLGELEVPRDPRGSGLWSPREPVPTALGGASNGMHVRSGTHLQSYGFEPWSLVA